MVITFAVLLVSLHVEKSFREPAKACPWNRDLCDPSVSECGFGFLREPDRGRLSVHASPCVGDVAQNAEPALVVFSI